MTPNLSKGIPVRFTPDDRYVIRVDVTDWSDRRYKALRAFLDAMDVDWREGYVLGIKRKEGE